MLNQAAKLAVAIVNVHTHDSNDAVAGCMECRGGFSCVHDVLLSYCSTCHQTVAKSLISAHDTVYKHHRDMQGKMHEQLATRRQLAAVDAAGRYLSAAEPVNGGNLRSKTQ